MADYSSIANTLYQAPGSGGAAISTEPSQWGMAGVTAPQAGQPASPSMMPPTPAPTAPSVNPMRTWAMDFVNGVQNRQWGSPSHGGFGSWHSPGMQIPQIPRASQFLGGIYSRPSMPRPSGQMPTMSSNGFAAGGVQVPGTYY